MNPENHQKDNEKAPKSVYLAAVIAIFFCTLSSADSIGFVPCSIDGTCSAAEAAPATVALSSLPQLGVMSATSTLATNGVLPVRLEIPSVGIDLPVQNPDTTDVDALDALLNKGPARYPLSAELGQSGNMIIFAHSSHLPIVHNKMFQAFNQIPNVKSGDSITLVGQDGTSYLYSVDSVVKADTQSGTTIPLTSSDGTKLTLVTCDTLTGVSARFILTATFLGKI